MVFLPPGPPRELKETDRSGPRPPACSRADVRDSAFSRRATSDLTIDERAESYGTRSSWASWLLRAPPATTELRIDKAKRGPRTWGHC